MRKSHICIILAVLVLASCGEKPQPVEPQPPVEFHRPEVSGFFMGTTMSFASYSQDLGLVYRENGVVTDPYKSVKAHGANMIRLQLDQVSFGSMGGTAIDWQSYSRVLADARKAKAEGLKLFLTIKPDADSFSESSTDHNLAPSSWRGKKDEQLGSLLHDWVYSTLEQLAKDGILPEVVAVGNEVNLGFLRSSASASADNTRAGKLLSYGWTAVREYALKYNEDCAIALHIANPAWAQSALAAMIAAGGDEFDIVALSYYPGSSIGHSFVGGSIPAVISSLKNRFGKQVMILETSYTFTDGQKDGAWAGDWCDNSYNFPDWSDDPAVRAANYSPAKQREWLRKLAEDVKAGGGIGLITWGTESLPDTQEGKEQGHGHGLYTYPAAWAYGSTWENNSYWDFTDGNNLHQGIDWMLDMQ